jgi:Domain of unknown function (DUF222)
MIGAPVDLLELARRLRDAEVERVVLAGAAARLAELRRFELDGATSMTSWLVQHAGMRPVDAAALVREGRFWNRYQAIRSAFEQGRIGAGHAAAIRFAVSSATEHLLDELQAELIESIEGLTVPDAIVAARRWQANAEAISERTGPPAERKRSWRMVRLDDGTGVGSFSLDAYTFAQLEHALQTAHEWEPDDQRPASARNADAFAAIIAFFNANHERDDLPKHRPHIELVASADEWSSDSPRVALGDGSVLPHDIAHAVGCDCVINRVVKAGSVVLDYGRDVRAVPKPLQRAVKSRDRGCRFPGCHRTAAWCDAHHVRWWRKHGETKLDNLVLLCSHHHHLVHKPGWQLELHADASVTVVTPTGRQLSSRPHPDPHDLSPPLAA